LACLPLVLPATAAGRADAAEPQDAARDERNAAVEAQLETARRQLEKAAHDVAELSARLGEPMIVFGPPRAIIGVLIDPRSGKDGAHVESVSPGGPAAEAGLRAGDVIVAVNGTDIRGEEPGRRLMELVRNVKPEAKVLVKVVREGKPLELTITARAPFQISMPPMPPVPPMPPMPPMSPFSRVFPGGGVLADMELATLTPQLGRYFGADKGVLVVRAPEGGALKLQDGDVILAIDGREPTSGSHATRILASYQPGEKITLRIVRDRKTLTVDAVLPEHSGARGPDKILRETEKSLRETEKNLREHEKTLREREKSLRERGRAAEEGTALITGYSSFLDEVKAHRVESVVLQGAMIYGVRKDGTSFTALDPQSDHAGLIRMLEEAGVSITGRPAKAPSGGPVESI
jgi:hypothetical protein